jgi:hypothetical protein
MSIIHYNDNLKAYELRIHGIRLESDSPNQFSIRKNELERINVLQIPSNVSFILQDETLNRKSELVKVKSILSRRDQREFWLRFEESSEANRWKNVSLMDQYFGLKKWQLAQRQIDKFDLVIQSAYLDEHCFFFQYTFPLNDVVNSQILKLTRIATDAVHSSSEEINNLLSDDMNHSRTDDSNY